MAGDVDRRGKPDASNIVLMMEQSARDVFPESGIEITVLEPKDYAGPDLMVVHPAAVNKELCAHCLACIKLCPSLSWDIPKARVIVNEVSCKGCGICGSVCPTGAISQRQYSPAMILDSLGKMWGENGNGTEIVSCGTCPVQPLGLNRMKTPEARGTPVRVVCSGRMEPIYVIESAKIGARAVLMIDCFGEVKERERFERGRKRMEAGARLLRTLGSPDTHAHAAEINASNASELGAFLKSKRFAGSVAHGGGS